MLITFFRGGKTDAFPAAQLDVPDAPAWLAQHAAQAPGHDKGGRGFVVFCQLRGGDDLTVAELNLSRAREGRPALSAAQEQIVRERGYRNYAHVAAVTAIGIDYDGNPEEPPNWDPEAWPCDVYAHTTHNYHPTERPGKWRAILPLATPMPIEREPQLRRALAALLPAGCMIRAPHQPAYLPTCPEGGAVQAVHVAQTDVPAELDWTVFVDLEAAPEVHATGLAAGTLIGAEFAARGLVARDCGHKLDVVCPWAAEHKSGGDLAFVYYTEDGAGKFGCAHGACQGRGTADAYEVFAPSEPVAIEPPIKVEPPGAFPLMTAEDMLAGDEPLPWAIEGLVSVGEPTLVVGGAGSGKTSAMVDLALSVASGRDVWGKFRVARPGPVVHIDYEQGKTLRRTYLAFARGMGLDAAAMVRDGRLRIATLPREQLLDANVTDKHLSAVGSEVLRLCRGASICVINSLTAGTNKVNENDAKIAAVFNLLSRITEMTGCAFIVLHHSGRGERKGARGSSAIDGAVQTIYQIEHAPGQTHTTWKHTKDRPAGGTVQPFRLDWKNEGGAQWLNAATIEPDPPPAPGAERPEDRIARAILFVMAHKGLSGKDRILECVRGRKSVKRTVWDDMLVKGTIERIGSRYLVAPGVVVRAEAPEGLDDEQLGHELNHS